jgi:hypothetical protein
MYLTKRMKEVLKGADLESGQINNVPMATMYGLEARGLVADEWRRAGGRTTQTSAGTFPAYSRVSLTAEGFRAARALNGIGSRL